MLLALLIALTTVLAPNRDHALFVDTVAHVIEREPPLFRDDDGKRKTAAFLTAIAFRESTFNIGAKSKTNDHCWFQIHARPDLAEDPEGCAETAMSMLRESMRACPAHPLAFYAEGPAGCESGRAQRISADRMALAAWVLRKVSP